MAKRFRLPHLSLRIRLTILISVVIWSVTIILFFLLQSFLVSNEMRLLDSLRVQFPDYVAEREDILNAFIVDRQNRYADLFPIAAVMYFVIIGGISYVFVNRYIGPLEDLLYQLGYITPKDRKSLLFYAGNLPEYKKLQGSINDLLITSEHKDKQLEELIQDAAHELKTPLFALRSSIEVLNLHKQPTKQEYRQFLLTSELISQKMSALIESLIILTKSSNQFVAKTTINLSDILLDEVALIKPKAEARRVSLDVSAEKKIMLKSQQRFISIMFSNILDNAIKYSPRQGKVKVSLQRTDGAVEFVCSDNGLGIPKSELKKIRERFYRASNAKEKGIEGTGLGLATVDKIVKAYGGVLKVTSELNKGTSVKISFPLAG